MNKGKVRTNISKQFKSARKPATIFPGKFQKLRMDNK